MPADTHLIVLALAWAGYGTVHSLLAANATKALIQKYFPRAFPGYRLIYNLLAGLLLAPPLWLLFSYPGEPLWRWPGALGWLADGLALAAIIGFAATLRLYDNAEFLGIRQLRNRSAGDDQAPMTLSWAHRHVRHPWYFLGLVVLWTREMNAALLVSAVIVTLYLVVGSRLEERKLVERYGDAYRRYRARVPGLVPLPWQRLDPAQAERILAQPQASAPDKSPAGDSADS